MCKNIPISIPGIHNLVTQQNKKKTETKISLLVSTADVSIIDTNFA